MSTIPKFGPGDVVNVKGYGGAAIVKNVEQDGTTPQGHPKWLYTVSFGAFNEAPNNTGTVSRSTGGKRSRHGSTLKIGTPGVSNPLHQFYQGRLEPFFNTEASSASNSTLGAGTTNVEVNYSELSAEELTELLAMLGLKVTNKANENQGENQLA